MCVCVYLGRTAREFDAREGDEDEDLDADGFRDEEVSDDDERKREEKKESSEKTSGFNGD